MQSATKVVLTSNNEVLHLSKEIIGGYSIPNSETGSAQVFFKGGMCWPIDSTEDNLKQLKSIKL